MNDQEILDYIEGNIEIMLNRFLKTNNYISQFDESISAFSWNEYMVEYLRIYFMDIYRMELDIAQTSAEQFVEKYKDHLKDLYNFERI